ncbi:MAG TPA: DUF2255 family protein [Myxococcota bacterium]|nr:DUF2255 family protein [Myxococcota bacterium]
MGAHDSRLGFASTRWGPLLVLGALLLSATRAPADPASPDWNAVAGVDTVEVVTKNADSTPRHTTVWLAVVDGRGYIRTGATGWWSNIERDPDVVLRIEGKEYPLRAVSVEDPALRQRVEDTFRAKYGMSDRVVGFFFHSVPHIMRLDPRGA